MHADQFGGYVTPKEISLALLSNPSVCKDIDDAKTLIEVSFGLAMEFNDALSDRVASSEFIG